MYSADLDAEQHFEAGCMHRLTQKTKGTPKASELSQRKLDAVSSQTRRNKAHLPLQPYAYIVTTVIEMKRTFECLSSLVFFLFLPFDVATAILVLKLTEGRATLASICAVGLEFGLQPATCVCYDHL